MESCLVSKQLIALNEINYMTAFNIETTSFFSLRFRVQQEWVTNADYIILSHLSTVENVHLNIDLFLGVITKAIIIIDICLLATG